MFYADNPFFFQSSDNSFQNSFCKPGSRQSICASSSKSISNLIISPKSPALSSSFNESDEDENFVKDSKFDENNTYMHTNDNVVKFSHYTSFSFPSDVFQNTSVYFVGTNLVLLFFLQQ
jgi:hypothetical protein